MGSRNEFVDEATVFVFGGGGGNGAASYRREKYRPKGGPDGGNGGNGGSIIFRADPNIGTLSELARNPHIRAQPGANGSGDDKHGANSPDRIVLVPEGTLIADAETDEVLADLVRAPAEAVVARGGRGGRGNAALATANRRAPGFSERGEEGDERRLRLELRVLADVGLVGVPNAGKSSLIATLSAARPKVAAYPFTTLTPHLGVAETDEGRYVVADVPGLIEGAAEGRGLGHAFLRHLQRCLVLCFVIDAAAPDPVADLVALRDELSEYDPALAERLAVIAANKMDLPDGAEGAKDLMISAEGAPVVLCSALTGEGTAELHDVLAERVAQAKAAAAQAAAEPKSRTVITIRPESDRILIEREDGAYRVIAPKAERLVVRFDMNNDEAVAYVQDRFVAMGVEDALTKAGAVEGDEVRIANVAFEFLPETSPKQRR